MFIDKKGKLFGKISIIDIILVLAVILIAVVLALRLGGKVDLPFAKQPDTNYTTKIKISALITTPMSPFNVDDKVYSEAGELIGTITDVEHSVYEGKEYLANGKVFDYKDPDYSDYTITVKGVGTVNENGVMAEGTYLLIPGNYMKIATKYFNGQSIVLSVEK